MSDRSKFKLDKYFSHGDRIQMTLFERQTGHSALRLRDIDPKRSPAFSPNLYRWMRYRAHFYCNGGVAETVYAVREDSRASIYLGAGKLFLGVPYSQYVGDNDFGGQALMGVLCNGAKAAPVCWAGLSTSLLCVDGFWDRYLEIGRCAIDPEHTEHFFGVDRYRVEGNIKTCLWCGAKYRSVRDRRIVVDESWMKIEG